jgi:hypothetical protein
MTDSQDPTTEKTGAPDDGSSWGVWLFCGTLVVVLVFFWWLLIESGGVSGNHG